MLRFNFKWDLLFLNLKSIKSKRKIVMTLSKLSEISNSQKLKTKFSIG